MLDTLPPEILTQIAYHLVLWSGSPPVALLATCSTVYAAVSPETNANLYADVFRATYDVAAATRRLPLGTGSDEPEIMGETPTPSGASGASTPSTASNTSHMSLTPIPRAPSLRPRQLAAELRNRTRALSRLAAKSEALREEDLWTVYLMLIENDGKNLTHLVKPFGPGPGVDMAAVVHSYHLRTLIWKDHYPPEGVVDALAMWIAWFLDEYSTRTASTLRSLRPYVFAAHVYELFFAPWTQLDLPTSRPVHARTCIVPSYGRELHLAAPLLTHAALLRFFGGPQDLDEPASASNGTRSEFAFDVAAADLRALPCATLSSANHDADYARLLACHDAGRTLGRRLSAWRGVFDGAWEGTFTFLDFDAFRAMLSNADGTRAVYSGPYGEQTQVWKLRETFVRPYRGVPGPTRQRRGLPLRGPMTNAGFPTDMRNFAEDPLEGRFGMSPQDATIDDALARQLAALPEFERVPEDELDAEIGRADAAWDAWAAGRRTANRSKSGKGRELATAAEGDTGLSILVTGVGHSAWGRFIISGHVRVWDGLVYLVKEYAPYQRGTWIYRGYVLSNDIMLGRWRDTFTHDEDVGYEGTFILNRR